MEEVLLYDAIIAIILVGIGAGLSILTWFIRRKYHV